MRRPLIVPIALVALLLVGALSPVAAQSQDYGISVDGSVDVPDRTIDFEGNSYHVSAVKQADPSDTVTVNVDAPSDELVEVYVYNADRQIVDSKENVGSGSMTFDLSGYQSGSYMFTLQYDGGTKVAHPLVIRAYDVSVTTPNEATTDTQVDLSATLTELQSASTSGVEFVIMNDQQTLRTDAQQTDGSYKATVDLSSMSTGEYSVYATVRGTKEVDGNKVRLGLSQPQSLTITDDSSNTGDGTNGGGSSGGGGAVDPGGSDTPADTDTPPTESDSPTDSTPSTSSPTDEHPSTPSQSEPGDGNDGATTASETTDNGVITPQSPTTQQSTTTTGTGPGFSAGVTGLVVLGVTVGLFCRRHWDN